MVIINKRSANNVVMTLTEKCTLDSPTFLFSFTNDITMDSVNFISTDISTARERYNEFVITDTTGTINYYTGTVQFNPTGTWSYRVFEQTSTTNLNPLLADNQEPVEIGQAKVIGTSTTYTGYSGQDNTITAYGTGA